jgi:hypothetical protein
MAFFAVLFAKLLDPVVIVLAAGAGALSRTWWHVLGAALLIAAVAEVILISTQVTRGLDPAIFLIGFLAAGAWASLAFVYRRWRSTSRT